MRLFPIFFLLALVNAQDFSSTDPPFTATSATLQAAFSKIDPGKSPVVVLLEEARYEFDAQGRQTVHYRTVFKAITKAGAEGWAMVERTWAPWQEERPTIHARVTSKDGTVHELDPKTVADAPARDNDDDVLTDRRKVRAPLPAMEAGSIVEEDVAVKQTTVPLGAGSIHSFYFGEGIPVNQTLVTIRFPESLPLRYKTQLLPNVVVSDQTKQGQRQFTFDQGPMPPLEDPPALMPSSEPRSPRLSFSTGSNWGALARAYSEVVEKQLAGFEPSSFLPKFPANATRDDKILAIISFLNKNIRYTGIEFSESELIPHKPSEVLTRKYGDCKDKSTLAVGLLRAAGIDAHIALLLSSTGQDIDPSLPAIDVFNHAIVYIGGEHALWLDPTDPFLRIGNVSIPNQGRYSLIARPETTELIRTPELTAEQNHIVEKRVVQLAEFGRAHIVESSEVSGTADRDYRMSFNDRDEAALQKSLKDYIFWTYGETKTQNIITSDSSDLSNPFSLKIDMAEAQRGTTGRTETAVAIRIGQLANRLPEFFRADPKQERKDATKPLPPRTVEFAVPEAYTYEWHYSINAPPGFKIRQLPEAINQTLGPATLTARFQSESATAVTADFRFVMPKRRFTAAEGLALRDAVVELNNRPIMLIYFDQIGETALASGNVKQALSEFATLRALHPNEALHAMQRARALLAAGAGGTAREEARQAVALEPGSAQMYIQLAGILKDDLVGRPMKKGYDRDGAAAAYRKALELDPNDSETRGNLAILFEYDLAGVRYGEGAKIQDAVAEYAKIQDKLTSLGLANNYPIALFHAGKMTELAAYLSKQTPTETTEALNVCAEAVLHGGAAGIAKAGEVSGVEARQRVLISAAQGLLAVRRYALAADVFSAAANGSPNPGAIQNLIEVLRKTKHYEEIPQVIQEPEDVIRRIMILGLTSDDWTDRALELMSSFAIERDDDSKALVRAMAGARSSAQTNGMTTEELIDLGVSAIQFVHDGSDETGWVVHMIVPGTSGSKNQVFFVVREKDTYRLLAGGNEFTGAARYARHLTSEGRWEQAKIWLDRIRPEMPAGNSDDPLSGSMFSRVWRAGQGADPKRVQLASALLLSQDRHGIAQTIETLESAAKSAGPGEEDAIMATLGEAYFTDQRYDQSLRIYRELFEKLPRSSTAFRLLLNSAYAAGGSKEAAPLLGANLSRFRDDPTALREAAMVTMRFGDVAQSVAITKRIVDSGRGSALDYNQIAWAELMGGKVNAATIETAKKGAMLASNDPSLLHTLAAVEADFDKPADARATLLQRMTVLNQEEPDDDDWYVFGRIAESYGLKQEASGMYRRLSQPRNEQMIAASSYAQAQKRLKAIAQEH